MSSNCESRVRWSAGGLEAVFFIMWGRKKELLNVNSGLMPPGAVMPSLLQVRCRSDGATGRIGRLFFHFGVHSLKRWEVLVAQFVTP